MLMDSEKFKLILEWVVRIALFAVLMKFVFDVIITQHEIFS